MIRLFGKGPPGTGVEGLVGTGEAGFVGTGNAGLASGLGCVGVEIALPELFDGGDGLDNVSTSRCPFREILASHTTSTPTATSRAREPRTIRIRRLCPDAIPMLHFYAKLKWKSKALTRDNRDCAPVGNVS